MAASFAEETPALNRVIYVVVGVAAIIGIIAIFSNRLLTRILGRLGHSSGSEHGPKPGEGAVIHHSSGEADFDGAPGDMPPSIKDRKARSSVSSKKIRRLDSSTCVLV